MINIKAQLKKLKPIDIMLIIGGSYVLISFFYMFTGYLGDVVFYPAVPLIGTVCYIIFCWTAFYYYCKYNAETGFEKAGYLVLMLLLGGGVAFILYAFNRKTWFKE